MLRKLILATAASMAAAFLSVLNAQNLRLPAQGAALMSMGFYGGAEEVFQQEESTVPTQENVKGLIQALLAQEKSAQAREVLESPAAKKLTSSEGNLYRVLISLQEGAVPETADLNAAELDQNEKECLTYLQGLLAFSKNDFRDADEIWGRLRRDGQLQIWALALSSATQAPASQSSDSKDSEALEKRFKKIRPQDWPVIRNYLLGMIARSEGDKARAFIEKNSSNLPKPEAELIEALSFGEKSPERAVALMKALPDLSDPRLLAIDVGLCQNETVVNMNDVEDQLKGRKTDPSVALILSQGWSQKDAFSHAYELLSAASPDTLSPEWQAAYYSTLSILAEKLTPPRHREAANALIQWRDLPSTTREQAMILQRQIGDVFYRNGDFSDAAVAYEK